MAGIITLHIGDITTDATADVIVNAANSSLVAGGGVDAAIHEAAGPAIQEECSRHGGCEEGDAKITSAGRLPARFIIHAVGPVWRDGQGGEPDLLGSAYRRAIELAAERACTRVALPAISAGAYGYPVAQAAHVALRATRSALRVHPQVKEARFWLYDQETYEVFSQVLQLIHSTPDPGAASPGTFA